MTSTIGRDTSRINNQKNKTRSDRSVVKKEEMATRIHLKFGKNSLNPVIFKLKTNQAVTYRRLRQAAYIRVA